MQENLQKIFLGDSKLHFSSRRSQDRISVRIQCAHETYLPHHRCGFFAPSNKTKPSTVQWKSELFNKLNSIKGFLLHYWLSRSRVKTREDSWWPRFGTEGASGKAKSDYLFKSFPKEPACQTPSAWQKPKISTQSLFQLTIRLERHLSF